MPSRRPAIVAATAQPRGRHGKSVLYFFLVVLALLQIFPLLWVFDYSILKSGDLFGPELLKLPYTPSGATTSAPGWTGRFSATS